MKELVRKSVLEMEAYQVSKDKISIKLDANESPYNLGDRLYPLLVQRLQSIDLNRYPDTDSMMLREAIGKYVGFPIDNILCGNGSDEMIQNIIQTFVEAGDAVVSHKPSFSMYKVFTTIAGGKFIEIESDPEFVINIDEIIEAANANHAKLIFICNPNNPTGTVITPMEIIGVMEATKAMIVVDEAYFEFYGESMIDWIKEKERLIVLRTLSKGMSLAGARIGYMVAQRQVIDYVYRVKPPYNLNAYSQALGELFLENIQMIQDHIQQIVDARDHLTAQLETLMGVKVYPSKSNFILVRTNKAREIQEKCKNMKIAIRCYGKEGILKDCLRITVGTKEENDMIKNIFQEVIAL